MKQQEAKAAILQVWDQWESSGMNSGSATDFWCFLREKYPQLLVFQTPGSDTHEAVKSWLIKAGKLHL